MARQIHRLSARKVETLKQPGRHADGGGLYLVVDSSSAKRWVFMSWKGGKQIELGLGGLATITLKQARERAAEYRRLVADGRDPRETRNAERTRPTFGNFSAEVITSLETGFRNEKHRGQWRSTLKTYATPINSLHVNAIETEDVLACLTPIWNTKNETASRVRGRIEKVLDAAKARGLRTGDNPARWRGHLDNLLPARRSLQRGHHPALPWKDIPDFMRRLRQHDTISAAALEFTILTAARSGETLNAVWREFDLTERIWTVPAHRMKSGREHRVPLLPAAIELLNRIRRQHDGDYVFSGKRPDRPLSNMAMMMVLRRMTMGKITVHGFRSSFCDWAADETSFPREVIEAALSHVWGDKVERAYRRGDALSKRRELMNAWADYCGSKQ